MHPCIVRGVGCVTSSFVAWVGGLCCLFVLLGGVASSLLVCGVTHSAHSFFSKPFVDPLELSAPNLFGLYASMLCRAAVAWPLPSSLAVWSPLSLSGGVASPSLSAM